MRRLVTIVQRVLPHYRVAFFDGLRDSLAEHSVELELIVGRPAAWEKNLFGEPTLDWAVPQRTAYLGGRARSIVLQGGVRRTRRSDLVVVEQATRLLQTDLLVLRRAAGRGPKLALWGQGWNHDAEGVSRSGEAIKRQMGHYADWFFGYTQAIVEFMIDNGFPPDRTTNVDNAIDTVHLRRLQQELDEDELHLVRRELGLSAGPVGVVIGSLYDLKRPEFLVDAADELRRALPDFQLIVIGDGPKLPVLESAASQRSWIYVTGALHDRELVRTAALGTVLLNPGKVGLNILDSFALGLPMVTVAGQSHAPEVDYLQSGANGLMLPATSSPAEFATAVAELLTNPKALELLRSGARRAAKRITVERMVDNFAGGVLAALDSDRRRKFT